MEAIMEVRQITPEEMTMKSKIQSIAFHFRKDFSKQGGNPDGFQEDYDTCRAAFNDEGKMCSCMELIPFDARFDGSIVKMGGIGAVATLPEERQKRYVRNIFVYIMKEMYEKDYTFSYLYPFSYPYYRKFGYELNMTLRCYRTGISSFRQFAQTGEMRLLANEEESVVVRTIYDDFIRDKNLAIVRTDKLWKHFLEKDPYKDNVYLYVWHDDAGQARGYIQYRFEDSPSGESNLHINELIWLDRKAFAGILGFIGALSAQINKLYWRAPDFVNLLTMFSDPYEISQEIVTYGMNRIVNVEKALQTMTIPSGSGEATIAVKDDFFPLNTGSYTLSWEGGSHTVRKSQSPPDISCDIQALSQLVTGFASISELEIAGRIAVAGNRAALTQVFPKKSLFINNFF
jgi:predicted acetyltransferase